MKKFASALITATCSVVLAVGIAGCSNGAASASASADHAVTVTASAQVRVTPDLARFSVSVMTRGAAAADAQASNSTSTNAVVAALKEAGVADENIQTTWSNLSPIYGSYDIIGIDAFADSDASEPAGYEMTTELSVSNVEIAQVGALCEIAVAAGATSTNGIQYYSSSYDESYALALEQALGAAREKAEVIARASNVGLGGVVNIVEGYQNTYHRYAESSMASADGAAMEISPGTISIEASVTVSYEIR